LQLSEQRPRDWRLASDRGQPTVCENTHIACGRAMGRRSRTHLLLPIDVSPLTAMHYEARVMRRRWRQAENVPPQISGCAGAHTLCARSVISAAAPFRPGALRRSRKWLN